MWHYVQTCKFLFNSAECCTSATIKFRIDSPKSVVGETKTENRTYLRTIKSLGLILFTIIPTL